MMATLLLPCSRLFRGKRVIHVRVYTVTNGSVVRFGSGAFIKRRLENFFCRDVFRTNHGLAFVPIPAQVLLPGERHPYR